ncbi:Glu/Leu/Phe/Val dehydrogenase dimerization domain-containing protein [Pseudonocardia acaciae]|uniref:Glu/Leu/Phe/Val dehydrogenase dimerization domain-containing protein n=1 Tax=Pseudonocardia acaciae TaxID=551276 RepID=UPI0007E8C997|nr:Glu/Leu/Phe/Val dehydrogenase dimerization domain-containing protein [Pseudonocardia acaciae]
MHEYQHEQVRIERGARSGVTIIVAIHSTALGPAIGGCRLWRYPGWRDALTDALRLSAGMTVKNATAGLDLGGGKAVIALPEGATLDGRERRDVLHDVGELVESFGGRYATGPDVGTGPDDMAVIGERTGHLFCRPESLGGSGDSSSHTADGVLAALAATTVHLDGGDPARHADLDGRRITVVGLGHVGERLARTLAAAGARLAVTDIDPARRALAAELGARWLEPGRAWTEETDVLVPAALGGALTHALVPELRCRAIVGPANNQLADEEVADRLHRRGVHWVPDYLAGAGGVIYAVARELRGTGHEEAAARVRGIGDTTAALLHAAARDGISPHLSALRRVRDRLAAARRAAAPGTTPPRTQTTSASTLVKP